MTQKYSEGTTPYSFWQRLAQVWTAIWRPAPLPDSAGDRCFNPHASHTIGEWIVWVLGGYGYKGC